MLRLLELKLLNLHFRRIALSQSAGCSLINPVEKQIGSNFTTSIRSYLSSAASNLEPSIEPPDAIFSLFRKYGFSDAQIKSMVKRSPRVLTSNTDNTIKLKLDHFLSFGYSHGELAKIASSNPSSFICGSLEKRLLPNLNILEKVFGSKEHAKTALNRCPRLLQHKLEHFIFDNLKILEKQGIRADKHPHVLAKYPRVLSGRPNFVSECVKKLNNLGVNPSCSLPTYLIGIAVMIYLSPTTWERKYQLYKSFGWSEKDFFLAFAKYPHLMLASDIKIKTVIRWFEEKLQLDPCYFVAHPHVLNLSLEKRIIPRCAVFSVLDSKGLLDKRPSLSSTMKLTEKEFKERFIDKHVEEAPVVFEAYVGKMEFREFEWYRTMK